MISKSITTVLTLFTLLVLVVPTGGVLQGALAQDATTENTLAQSIVDRTFQEIEQEGEQELTQGQEQTQSNDQSANQSNTAEVSQDETNSQANVLDTGDNTASTTQVGDNDAVDNKIKAESEGGDSGDAKAKKHSEASTSGGDSGDASADLSQNVTNTATTIQDSSADDNILANENVFGDDIALIDQDNISEEDSLNLGLQDEDATQDQVQDQLAENINLDFDFQYGFQLSADWLDDWAGGGWGAGDVEFCVEFFDTALGVAAQACFPTLVECEAAEADLEAAGTTITAGCRPVRWPTYV